jgi:DNA-binding NarL/FixJ family response regulator
MILPQDDGEFADASTVLCASRDSEDTNRKSQRIFRVLLVDDYQPERELLWRWLEETGHFAVVGEACDGPSGIAMARTLQPDLVTLDMSMPGGDGIAALRHILGASPASTLVVVSGLVTAGLVDATVALGASACLSKAIGSERLVEELLHAVQRDESQDS